MSRIKNLKKTLLSDNYYTLCKFNFDYQKSDGSWVNPMREVYERGHGAGILLYNTTKKTVILIKQFRLPTYLHDNKDGFLIEIPAGMLDEDNPEQYTEDMKVSKGGGLAGENEDIEVLELPFTEAVRMLNEGEIVDTRTIVLLQYAQIHKLLD